MAIDGFTAVRMQRGAEHLHSLGPRAIAELLVEVGARTDGMSCILNLLGEYERRLTPAMLSQTGGDRFPPRTLQQVPQ